MSAIVLCLAVPASREAFAGATGTLQIDITDEEGAAVIGAEVIVTDPANASFLQKATSDKRGRVVILGLSSRNHIYKVTKDGFQGYESNFTAHAGDIEKKKLKLTRLAAGSVVDAASGQAIQKVEDDPAILLYNEAITLFKSDRDEEALARLKLALEKKPAFPAATSLQGIIHEEHGECDRAVPLLKTALEADSTVTTGISALIRCLEKAGAADEAAKYREMQAKTGRSKADLYNDAVARINANDDAGASALLEEALRMDPKYGIALYQYGLVLFRKGDIPGALERLETYLKLEPKGEFAADAEALIKALKG